MEYESAMCEDAALVRRMADGDERAISRLYDEYSPRLFGLALTLVGEQTDAEEVVLDAFTQAWRSAGTFDAGRGSVRTWLLTITRSRALDCIRSRTRRLMAHERASTASSFERADGDAAHSCGASVIDTMLHEELQARLNGALRLLPPEQREVIELSFLSGASHASVAGQLGLPLGTVKTRARSALRKLRSALTAADSSAEKPAIADGATYLLAASTARFIVATQPGITRT
ncbi:sigma-70 family RNA polymerase sigma factor [Gemmatimonas sp.]|uniref:RNA polymerase sigma factor n=1 Tax=Gemmatimonas sp. TaxID=1962908 RepID=UPI00286DC36C|nr:sigma-70 family RNA polymerase sigma factor [Gemmatimonas sp.]